MFSYAYPGSRLMVTIMQPMPRKEGPVPLVEREVEGCAGCTIVQVKDTRWILPLLASRFYGRPSQNLRVVGVTGTNGKTTTTHLIAAILQEAGYAVGLVGTLNASFRGYQEKLANTTPESLDLERFMRRVSDEGGRYVVMEVSSHALDLGRVSEIDLRRRVHQSFPDHPDFHRNLTITAKPSSSCSAAFRWTQVGLR